MENRGNPYGYSCRVGFLFLEKQAAPAESARKSGIIFKEENNESDRTV